VRNVLEGGSTVLAFNAECCGHNESDHQGHPWLQAKKLLRMVGSDLASSGVVSVLPELWHLVYRLYKT